MMQITLSEENYKILHKLIGDQLDAIFSLHDDDLDFQPTEEQTKILNAVTLFSSYQVTHHDCTS